MLAPREFIWNKAMNSGQVNDSLFDALRRLYSKIAMRVLQQRMGSYRRYSGIDSGGDIASTLSDHIKRVADSQRMRKHEGGPATSTPNVQPTRHPPAATPPGSEDEKEQPPGTPGELSKYFETNHTGAVFDPHLGADLKKRTWEHIHATLRYAAQGQEKTARLHADLATSAFKEAVHYMPDEEIAEFAAAVEKKLKSLGSNQGNPR